MKRRNSNQISRPKMLGPPIRTPLTRIAGTFIRVDDAQDDRR